MSYDKQIIREFIWHERFMALHWAGMKYAFSISREWGDAKIFHLPDQESNVGGIYGAMGQEEIVRFDIQPISVDTWEIILRVTYGDNKLSLGISTEVELVQRWVQDANSLLQSVKQRTASA